MKKMKNENVLFCSSISKVKCMLCIHKINKLFDMIPRMKHYKDTINVLLVDFRFKRNWATILPFLFKMKYKYTLVRVALLHLFGNKDCC